MSALMAPVETTPYVFASNRISQYDIKVGAAGFMHPLSLHEIQAWLVESPFRTIYIKLEERLDHPYNAVDYVQVIDEDLQMEIFGKPTKPALFAEAYMCFAPKMSII